MILREGDNLDWMIFDFGVNEDANEGPGAHFESLFSWLDVNFKKIQVITVFHDPKVDHVHLIYRKVAPDVSLTGTPSATYQ